MCCEIWHLVSKFVPRWIWIQIKNLNEGYKRYMKIYTPNNLRDIHIQSQHQKSIIITNLCRYVSKQMLWIKSDDTINFFLRTYEGNYGKIRFFDKSKNIKIENWVTNKIIYETIFQRTLLQKIVQSINKILWII